MLRRLILTLTLAFLFGLGQQGALVHQLSHLDDLAPASQQQQDKAAHSVCDECLSHSVLAFALGAEQFKPFLAAYTFELPAYLQAQPSTGTFPTYQARAPPQFI